MENVRHPEQKEEWESMKKVFLERYVNPDDRHNADASLDGMKFFAEERGRRETITAFVEWAGKQEWLNKGDLLKFADSLKSNLTQKS